MKENLWVVRMPQGKRIVDKIVNISREKHRVIMGRLHDAKTNEVIGIVLRPAGNRKWPR